MIDFAELKDYGSGDGLEALSRFLGRRIPAEVHYTGVGPDGGKDLIFEERLSVLCEKSFRWLVSCKDRSVSGKNVSEKDLPTDLFAKLAQHNCDGFMLVTTKQITGGLKNLLDGLKQNKGLHYKIWDRFELENMLWKAKNTDLIIQFFPKFYHTRFGDRFVVSEDPESDQHTTVDMNETASKTLQQTEEELNALVADILDSALTSEWERKYLQESQALWQNYRMADCCLTFPPEHDGTIGTVMRLSSLTRETDHRLERLRQWWSWKLSW
ncbi:MAG: lysozyme inhibitor LprI family protein [Candidatus Obscuribacterales bacterium]|nr:lysozyme inhibitor LprI family protein [Candidatus Obscuribacterales bacterium]